MRRKVKKPGIADILLHPERLEILRAFESGGPLSVRQVHDILPTIAESTLYRHVKTLAKAGVLKTVETRTKERGAPEAIYAIPEHPIEHLRLKGRERSPASLRRYLLAIQTAQMVEFERTIEQGSIDEDDLIIRSQLIYVNEAERREIDGLFERLADFASNPKKGRKAFSLGLLLFPAP